MRVIKQFVVRLSDDEHIKLKQMAFEKNVSIQQIFNEMVVKCIDEYGKQRDCEYDEPPKDFDVSDLENAVESLSLFTTKLKDIVRELEKCKKE